MRDLIPLPGVPVLVERHRSHAPPRHVDGPNPHARATIPPSRWIADAPSLTRHQKPIALLTLKPDQGRNHLWNFEPAAQTSHLSESSASSVVSLQSHRSPTSIEITHPPRQAQGVGDQNSRSTRSDATLRCRALAQSSAGDPTTRTASRSTHSHPRRAPAPSDPASCSP